MKIEDKKNFLVLMAMLGEAFKEDVSSERAKIYFEFLKDKPIFEISYAFKRAIRELKFFPKISEIIELMTPYEVDEEAPHIKSQNKEAVEYIKKMASIIGKPIPRVERLPYKED
jgi:hypothetical protein